MANFLTDGNNYPIPVLKPTTTKVVTYTATKGDSSAYSGRNVVRLVATSACHVAVGSGAAATTADAYLPADNFLEVIVGDGENISVIQSSASGTLYATKLV